MKHTDKILGFFKLIRVDKPVGTLLLLWPTLSAFIVLTQGSPNYFLLSLFVLGTFLMRSAGCVINDYFDMEFDGSVQRTKDRPLVTGIVKPSEALILFFFLIFLSGLLLNWMNWLTIKVAAFGLVLATFYPLTKGFLPYHNFSWGWLFLGAY